MALQPFISNTSPKMKIWNIHLPDIPQRKSSLQFLNWLSSPESPKEIAAKKRIARKDNARSKDFYGFHLFPLFHPIPKKHISLSHAFCPSAWWNRRRRFLFLHGVNNVLFPKSKLSKFHAPGNDTTDTPRRWSYINISIRDLLYKTFGVGVCCLSLSGARYAKTSI